MSLPSGTRLGDWVVENPLGAGGMGSVYRCHSVLAKDVLAAVKVLKASDLGDFEKRFIQEMRTLAGLKHPNIVAVHGGGRCEERDIMYMAMEFIEGEDLDRRIKRGPMTPEEALKVFGPVSNALAYAHQNNIAHRDIKPANIMLRPDGIPIIVDFGIAVSAGQTRMTQEGGIPGTVAYMPPEVFAGGLCEPRSSDAYALGVVMWEMLTGTDPFAPKKSTPGSGQQFAQVMAMKLRSDALEISDSAPAGLQEVVRRTTDPEPETRLSDMAEVSAMLEAAGAPKGPTLPGWSRSQPIQPPAPKRGLWKMGLTGLLSAGCATAIALAAVGGIGLLLWFNGAFSGPKDRPAVNLVETLQEANVALERKQYAQAVKLAGLAIDDHPADPHANLAYGMALAGAKKGHLSRPYLCAAKSQGVGAHLDSINCERGLGAETPLSPSILLAQLDPDDLVAALTVPVDAAPVPVPDEGVESFAEEVADAAKPRESRKSAPTPKPTSAPPSVASAPETHRKGAPDLDDFDDSEADDGIGGGGDASSNKGGILFSGSAPPPSNVAPPPAPPPPPPPPPSISKRGGGKKGGGSKESTRPAPSSSGKSASTSSDIRIQVLAADGGLSETLVQATTKRYASRLNYCYEQGLGRDPGMTGSLILVLQVDETGRVLSVTYVSPTAMDAPLRQCVKTNLNRLRFAEASEGTLIEIMIRFTVN